MKILRATATSDLCVHPDCEIVDHPTHGRSSLRIGKAHWIPVVSWVRLRSPSEGGEDDNGEEDSLEAAGPTEFEKLESGAEVLWVSGRGAR